MVQQDVALVEEREDVARAPPRRGPAAACSGGSRRSSRAGSSHEREERPDVERAAHAVDVARPDVEALDQQLQERVARRWPRPRGARPGSCGASSAPPRSPRGSRARPRRRGPARRRGRPGRPRTRGPPGRGTATPARRGSGPRAARRRSPLPGRPHQARQPRRHLHHGRGAARPRPRRAPAAAPGSGSGPRASGTAATTSMASGVSAGSTSSRKWRARAARCVASRPSTGRMRIPRSPSAGRISLARASRRGVSTISWARAEICWSCCPGVRPARSGAVSPSRPRRSSAAATRTMKNSSRFEATMVANFSRSRSGFDASVGLLEDAAVELEPGQLAVQEQLGLLAPVLLASLMPSPAPRGTTSLRPKTSVRKSERASVASRSMVRSPAPSHLERPRPRPPTTTRTSFTFCRWSASRALASAQDRRQLVHHDARVAVEGHVGQVRLLGRRAPVIARHVGDDRHVVARQAEDLGDREQVLGVLVVAAQVHVDADVVEQRRHLQEQPVARARGRARRLSSSKSRVARCATFLAWAAS